MVAMVGDDHHQVTGLYHYAVVICPTEVLLKLAVVYSAPADNAVINLQKKKKISQRVCERPSVVSSSGQNIFGILLSLKKLAIRSPSMTVFYCFTNCENASYGIKQSGTLTHTCVHNKANLRDLIAATGLVILLKLDSNRPFFGPCDLEIWWMTLKNNRALLLCYFKLCASFHSHQWIQSGVRVRKRPIRFKIVNFLARVTLIFNEWPWKTIGHLSYAFQALCII